MGALNPAFSPLREETTTTEIEPQTPRTLPTEFTLRRTRGSPTDNGKDLVVKFLKVYGVDQKALSDRIT